MCRILLLCELLVARLVATMKWNKLRLSYFVLAQESWVLLLRISHENLAPHVVLSS